MADIKDGLNKFIILSEERSQILWEINKHNNEIISITERLESMTSGRGEVDRTSKNFDQVMKAKDKRKHLRETIAELAHTVRLKEAELKSVEMELKFNG
tara:strand:- start:5529 stop:5825 length:297 start_codon:yes stop_codon:yes gene_type:complete